MPRAARWPAARCGCRTSTRRAEPASSVPVALDDHDLELVVEAHVDGLAVRLGHLDLVGRAVLGVGLDAVDGAAAGGPEGGLPGLARLLLGVVVAGRTVVAVPRHGDTAGGGRDCGAQGHPT